MMLPDRRRLRVVIVDDSAYVRYVLKTRFELLGAEVIAMFGRGEHAVEAVPQLDPDLVTMDVLMPGLGGIQTVRKLRSRWSGIIIMVSSQTRSGAVATWDALDAGANDFVSKPAPPYPLDSVMETLLSKTDALLDARNRRRQREDRATEITLPERDRSTEEIRAIVIGASTGGPQAVSVVLSAVRAIPRIPVFIVQHMPVGFTTSFAERLTRQMGFPVMEVPSDGTSISLRSAPVVLATGGRHLRISGERCWSESGTRLHGVIPAVDVTIQDAVEAFGRHLGVVILTGMGQDGCQGSIQAHQRGAWVVAESEDTAVVWGMPGAVVQAGVADAIWPVEKIGRWLNGVVTVGSGMTE